MNKLKRFYRAEVTIGEKTKTISTFNRYGVDAVTHVYSFVDGLILAGYTGNGSFQITDETHNFKTGTHSSKVTGLCQFCVLNGKAEYNKSLSMTASN